MKKVLIVCLIICSVLLLCLGLNYGANEKMIGNYNQGNYKINSLDVLGFLQPYVGPYNRGNIHYQLGDYDQAISEYQEALQKYPPHSRECKIRINLALAMVNKLDFSSITEENIEEVKDTLNQAIDVLVEKDCANRDGQSGHDAEAQQLEVELQRILDALEQPQNNGGGKDEDKKQQSGLQESKPEKKAGTTEEKSELEKKFEEQQQEVQQERNQRFENEEIFRMEYDYTTDPVW